MVYAVAASLWEARHRAFWFDEVFTAVLAEKPRFSDIVSALQEAADTSGPAYYIVQRAGRRLATDPHLGYRLSSVVAVPLTAFVLFVVARRETGAVPALVAPLVVFGSQLFHGYSVEARPYALLVFGMAVATLAWQRADSRIGATTFGLTLAATVSLHYYAVFALPVFAAGELVRTYRQRRVRALVWVGLAAGGLALAALWPLLSAVRGYYGENYWSTPSIGKVLSTYDTLSGLGAGGAGLGVALVLGTAMLLMLARHAMSGPGEPGGPSPEMLVFTAGVIGLPVIVAGVAAVMGGGYTDRYALGCVIGIALGASFACSRFPVPAVSAVVLAMTVVFGARELAFWGDGEPGARLRQGPPMNTHPQVLARATDRGLPLVVGSALDVVPLAYYNRGPAPPIIAIADHQLALRYEGTDSLDRDLVVFSRHFPLRVESLSSVTTQYRSFLLLARPGPYSWLAGHLIRTGHTLRVIEQRGVFAVYEVDSANRGPMNDGR